MRGVEEWFVWGLHWELREIVEPSYATESQVSSFSLQVTCLG